MSAAGHLAETSARGEVVARAQNDKLRAVLRARHVCPARNVALAWPLSLGAVRLLTRLSSRRPILGGNLLRQPAFKDWAKQDLPGADRVHDHGLYVGLHPVSDSGVDRVADLIGEFCG